MRPKDSACIAAAIVAGFAAAAQAGQPTIQGWITADNHYALYAKIDGAITLIGMNESGPGGSSGTYNWSQAESWTITNSTDIYIAGWSDKAVAQGLLASFVVNGSAPLRSGDAVWSVIATGVNLGDGSPAPAAAQVDQFVTAANLNSLWAKPYVGGVNGVAPWGGIANIDAQARWMWAAPTEARSDTIDGGANFDEYLIFHASLAQVIPSAPTAAALVLVAAVGRRRR